MTTILAGIGYIFKVFVNFNKQLGLHRFNLLASDEKSSGLTTSPGLFVTYCNH